MQAEISTSKNIELPPPATILVHIELPKPKSKENPMAPRLHTIIASTRPGRVGPVIAHWFHEFAKAHGKFDAHLVDLADFNLPVYDEPQHPSRRDYQHEHTKKWSESVKAADAFVFVTPEYNYTLPPSLSNALDYVFWEWQYTPVGFVS